MVYSAAANLSNTVAQAIAYLTRPLLLSYSTTTITKLQNHLAANLTATFASTWSPKEPLRGSGRRCLTLSPHCLPPRSIYSACLSAGVQWFDWIALLGGREFELFVDPDCVSIRFGHQAEVQTIWSDEPYSRTKSTAAAVEGSRIQTQFNAQVDAIARGYGKTLAQQLLEDDEEEGQSLFAMIASEVTDPTWTPIIDQFPIPPRSSSPLSTISSHSRSSSCSSTSSAGLSLSSMDSVDSYGSFTSLSSSGSCVGDPLRPAISRRERARHSRVYIDHSKTEVTPYDGGKTTVLTGGVMLGGSVARKVAKQIPMAANPSWRQLSA